MSPRPVALLACRLDAGVSGGFGSSEVSTSRGRRVLDPVHDGAPRRGVFIRFK